VPPEQRPTAVIGRSVRPPDLEPDAVRDAPDPLSGWDVGTGPPPAHDRRPFPTDTVVVVAAGLVGLIAGALTGRRPVRDAGLGGLGGLVAAGALRRIWRLP
jgi:hypothetical protein